MKEESKRTLRTGRKTGALIGGILFVIFGIVPGFYFGSYATLVLLSSFTDGPVEPGIIVRILVVAGILLGLFCTAAVSVVVGSVAGTVLAYVSDNLTSTFRRRQKTKETESAAHTG